MLNKRHRAIHALADFVNVGRAPPLHPVCAAEFLDETLAWQCNVAPSMDSGEYEDCLSWDMDSRMEHQNTIHALAMNGAVCWHCKAAGLGSFLLKRGHDNLAGTACDAARLSPARCVMAWCCCCTLSLVCPCPSGLFSTLSLVCSSLSLAHSPRAQSSLVQVLLWYPKDFCVC